jgi:hypothetical protein
MKNSNNLFSAIAVVVIAIAIPVTAYILINSNFDFRISAFQSDEPVKITISDVRSDGFRVSWLTEKPVVGGAKLVITGSAPSLETVTATGHTIQFKNLEANKKFTFVLISDGKEFTPTTNTVTTAKTISNSGNFLVYGQVFSKDGVTFQQGGTISLKITKGSTVSQLISTNINQSGGYQFNLSGTLDKDLSGNFIFSGTVDLELAINPNNKDAVIVKKLSLDFAKSRQIPNLYLGDVNIDVIPGVAGN